MFKKLLVGIVFAATATIAVAGPHGHRHNHGWVAPLVGGFIVGAAVASSAQAAPVYVPPAPVYYQPHQYVVPQPVVSYRNVNVFLPECNCWRTVQIVVQ